MDHLSDSYRSYGKKSHCSLNVLPVNFIWVVSFPPTFQNRADLG